jgi:hypothetical protein
VEHSTDAATVVSSSDGDPVMTDGPFVESKEHIGGFYVINAEDLDAALAWAGKTAEATNHPIEVRPFRATGRVEDWRGGASKIGAARRDPSGRRPSGSDRC